ncbi:MAG: hypothetical protein KJ069_16140 [Anaerolineae bacterium]|nr:hypothetical protein [Anaerolineae bacterium]
MNSSGNGPSSKELQDALLYLKAKNYISEDVSYYRLTGDGLAYMDSIIHGYRSTEENTYRGQRLGNKIALIALVATVLFGLFQVTDILKTAFSNKDQPPLLQLTPEVEVSTPTREFSIVFPSTREPVIFLPGAISHKLTSTLEPGSFKGYELYILANQQMIVHATGDITLVVWDSSKSQLTPTLQENARTEVFIPRNGYYTIAVYGNGEFSLEIIIPPLH